MYGNVNKKYENIQGGDGHGRPLRAMSRIDKKPTNPLGLSGLACAQPT